MNARKVDFDIATIVAMVREGQDTRIEFESIDSKSIYYRTYDGDKCYKWHFEYGFKSSITKKMELWPNGKIAPLGYMQDKYSCNDNKIAIQISIIVTMLKDSIKDPDIEISFSKIDSDIIYYTIYTKLSTNNKSLEHLPMGWKHGFNLPIEETYLQDSGKISSIQPLKI